MTSVSEHDHNHTPPPASPAATAPTSPMSSPASQPRHLRRCFAPVRCPSSALARSGASSSSWLLLFVGRIVVVACSEQDSCELVALGEQLIKCRSKLRVADRQGTITVFTGS